MPYLKKTQKQQTSFKKKERDEIYTSTKWKKLRSAYLQQNPLCELCYNEGRITPAIDVHHIISFMSTDNHLKRISLAYNPDNLMSLCKQCHQKVHSISTYKK